MIKVYCKFLLLIILLSCNTPEKTAENLLPIKTVGSNAFLNIKKSKFYPASSSLVEASIGKGIEKDGFIVDTIDFVRKINFKFWLSDSGFKNLSTKENLKYSKKFYLDTILQDDDFKFENAIIINAVNDTADFLFKIKSPSLPKNTTNKKWAVATLCRFEDNRGIKYDSAFMQYFNYQIKK